MHKPTTHTDKTSTFWETRYTFSAKEKDSETGYLFPIAIVIGARYGAYPDAGEDSESSVWLSVDALSDKYLSTSPYMYVLENRNGNNQYSSNHLHLLKSFEVCYFSKLDIVG